MPISVEKQKPFPGGSINSKEWKAIRAQIQKRAGDACEWCKVEMCAKYSFEGLFPLDQKIEGADAYEIEDFGAADNLTITESIATNGGKLVCVAEDRGDPLPAFSAFEHILAELMQDQKKR